MVVMQTRGSSKLTRAERKDLILDLCRAFAVLHSSQEVADALTDLFTPKEVETIAKRLKIAEYLVKGKEYQYIRDVLKVGYSTIARMNTWLNLSGAGLKIIFSRKNPPPKTVTLEERYDPYSWHNIKRRYSMAFWPQLLFEEYVKMANYKEKEKIRKIMEKLELKNRRFNSRENKKLYEIFSSKIAVKSNTYP